MKYQRDLEIKVEKLLKTFPEEQQMALRAMKEQNERNRKPYNLVRIFYQKLS
jgi:hypothetical protein